MLAREATASAYSAARSGRRRSILDQHHGQAYADDQIEEPLPTVASARAPGVRFVDHDG